MILMKKNIITTIFLIAITLGSLISKADDDCLSELQEEIRKIVNKDKNQILATRFELTNFKLALMLEKSDKKYSTLEDFFKNKFKSSDIAQNQAIIEEVHQAYIKYGIQEDQAKIVEDFSNIEDLNYWKSSQRLNNSEVSKYILAWNYQNNTEGKDCKSNLECLDEKDAAVVWLMGQFANQQTDASSSKNKLLSAVSVAFYRGNIAGTSSLSSSEINDRIKNKEAELNKRFKEIDLNVQAKIEEFKVKPSCIELQGSFDCKAQLGRSETMKFLDTLRIVNSELFEQYEGYIKNSKLALNTLLVNTEAIKAATTPSSLSNFYEDATDSPITPPSVQIGSKAAPKPIVPKKTFSNSNKSKEGQINPELVELSKSEQLCKNGKLQKYQGENSLIKQLLQEHNVEVNVGEAIEKSKIFMAAKDIKSAIDKLAKTASPCHIYIPGSGEHKKIANNILAKYSYSKKPICCENNDIGNKITHKLHFNAISFGVECDKFTIPSPFPPVGLALDFNANLGLGASGSIANSCGHSSGCIGPQISADVGAGVGVDVLIRATANVHIPASAEGLLCIENKKATLEYELKIEAPSVFLKVSGRFGLIKYTSREYKPFGSKPIYERTNHTNPIQLFSVN